MKKDTLIEIILGTIGGLIFAVGMCMRLIAEWNMLKAGVVVSIIGAFVLLAIIPVFRKTHPKERKAIDVGLVMTWIVGIVGALVMGFGMSKIMVGTASTIDFIVGMVAGVIGLLVCVLNYPIYAYLKNK